MYPAYTSHLHKWQRIGMSCPIWQWHRTGYRCSPVRTLPVAPLWCDLRRCSRTAVVIKLRRTPALQANLCNIHARGGRSASMAGLCWQGARTRSGCVDRAVRVRRLACSPVCARLCALACLRSPVCARLRALACVRSPACARLCALVRRLACSPVPTRLCALTVLAYSAVRGCDSSPTRLSGVRLLDYSPVPTRLCVLVRRLACMAAQAPCGPGCVCIPCGVCLN